MITSVQYGSRKIEFQLKHSNRKTLGITVKPDLSVLVTAPANVSLEMVKGKIKKRAHWIIKQQNYFYNFHPKTPPRKYLSGESHLYLGRHYRLKVKKSLSSEVKISNGYLYVDLNNHKDTIEIKSILDKWYKERAEIIFNAILENRKQDLTKKNISIKPLTIRFMKSRWGSCTSSKRIILNSELIKAPKKCIEYVIIHEMCHLKHPNHGKAFYALQSSLFPDWEYWKNKLEIIMS